MTKFIFVPKLTFLLHVGQVYFCAKIDLFTVVFLAKDQVYFCAKVDLFTVVCRAKKVVYFLAKWSHCSFRAKIDFSIIAFLAKKN